VGFEQQTEGCYVLRRSDITVHQAYSASAIDANLLPASTLLEESMIGGARIEAAARPLPKGLS
jgi:hypothetical protein